MIDPYEVCTVQAKWHVISERKDIIKESIPHWENLMGVIDWSSLELPLKLVAFPEGCLDGWPEDLFDIKHEEAYEKFAIDIPGEETDRLGALAKKYGVHLIFTAKAKWPEVIEKRIFNTAIIIDPKGEVIHKYAKNIVATFETTTTPHDVLDAWIKAFGNDLKSFFPVADTEIGRIGTLICMEGSFPETWRGLAVNGAEIIYRSSYLNYGGVTKWWRLQNQANALFNSVYAICPNNGDIAPSAMTGLPGVRTPYETLGTNTSGGESMVVDYRGQIVNEVNHNGEAFFFAPINIETLRDYRNRSGTNWIAYLKSEIFRKIYDAPIYPANQRMKKPQQRAEYTRAYFKTIDRLTEKGVFVAPVEKKATKIGGVTIEPEERESK